MKKESLEKHLLSLTGAQECYPFGPEPMVFKVMNKMFAYVSLKEGVPVVTLKCVPLDGEILAEQFQSISPGYHMNKKHWITVSLTDEIPDDMLIDLADKSYELVVSKLTKSNRAKLQQQVNQEN
ncbi:MAG: MmcQ/YjbR family DNA-binding protein [Phormidesmis sp.]